jgi:hypothetical protein
LKQKLRKRKTFKRNTKNKQETQEKALQEGKDK